MCGIAGILRFDDTAIDIEALQTILNKLEHRGRDQHHIKLGSKHIQSHSQISSTSEIGLGHRRLSIIDLHESAAQPMSYADNKLWLTYNGEIYNYLELKSFLKSKSYSFKTNSDSEVILAAYHYWGKQCVHHLNGMFAFAIWDENARQLFCARDQLGIKPFYYRLQDKYFAFSSESKALAHLSEHKLNQDALFSYLLSMYVLTNDSIYSGIKKLKPGHTLTINTHGQIFIEKYWSINEFNKNIIDNSHIEYLDQLLNVTIKRQLQSDVPVGSFLSGGIDSGLITALAAPHAKQFHTYSVAYEGMRENELPHARQIAERYHTQHTEIMITASDAMQYLNKALANMSEPIADPAIVATYMLAERASQDGVKVLLNGTGGDEIFAGYTRYTGQLSLKRRLLLSLPKVIKNLLPLLPIDFKLKSRLKHISLDMIFSTGGSYLLAQSLAEHKNYLPKLVKHIANEFTLVNQKQIPLLYQQMLFDIHAYLPEELLFLLDQMTMAHTIEGRVPLLDIDLVKYAFSFTASHHIANGQTKAILKQTASRYLGNEAIYRKKQGFAGSPSWWVKHNYDEFVSSLSVLNDILPSVKIDSVIKSANENEIFILYCLAKWYENINKPVNSNRITRNSV